jgi:glycosyltransferase involved in cell wall biosynthesis
LTANTDKANPLRIGLMLRAIDDVDGQGIYIRKLCDALFDLDTRNEYVAFYSDECQAGRYADRDNVREIVVRGRGKLLWDQVSVPLAARRERVDVLFHHKFSIPLIASSPTVVQQRGTEYWSHPEFYVGWAGRLDRIYNRIMIPLYCRRAARVLTNSNTLGKELIRYIDVPRSKLRTVYASADESFRPVTDTGILSRVRAQYSLPAYPFLLMVVKGHQVMGQASGKALTPRKNVEVALEAYGRMRRYAAERALPAVPDLVILGLGIAERITEEMILERADSSTVHTPGFVAFDDMPAVYTMARALIFPLALRKLRNTYRGGNGVRMPGGYGYHLSLPRDRRRRRSPGRSRRCGRIGERHAANQLRRGTCRRAPAEGISARCFILLGAQRTHAAGGASPRCSMRPLAKGAM